MRKIEVWTNTTKVSPELLKFSRHNLDFLCCIKEHLSYTSVFGKFKKSRDVYVSRTWWKDLILLVRSLCWCQQRQRIVEEVNSLFIVSNYTQIVICVWMYRRHHCCLKSSWKRKICFLHQNLLTEKCLWLCNIKKKICESSALTCTCVRALCSWAACNFSGKGTYS